MCSFPVPTEGVSGRHSAEIGMVFNVRLFAFINGGMPFLNGGGGGVLKSCKPPNKLSSF